jgi:hypothetical protein
MKAISQQTKQKYLKSFGYAGNPPVTVLIPYSEVFLFKTSFSSGAFFQDLSAVTLKDS